MVSRFLREAIGRLIRWGLTTSATDESGDFPKIQITYLGKLGDAIQAEPYGFHARVPSGALGPLFAADGLPENRFILPGSPSARPRDLEPGEHTVYHPGTGARVVFRNDGSIEVEAVADVRVIAGGDVSVVAAGETSVLSVLHTVDADLAHEGAEAGFHGVAPSPISPAYTVMNLTPDRVFDAGGGGAGIAQLRAVVGTIVVDLQAKGLLG